MKDGASSVVNTHLNSQVSTECDVRNTEPYLVRAAAPVLAINQRFRFQKQKSCAPHAARPSARSPHGEAALPQVGGDDVGVAPRDGNGHGAVVPCTISLGANTFLNFAPSWMKLLMNSEA